MRSYGQAKSYSPGRWCTLGVWPIVAACSLVGCTQAVSPHPTAAIAARALPADDELCLDLEEVLDGTFANRHMNLREHAAWQVMHGVLTYKRKLLVDVEPGGERTAAIDYLLSGGTTRGWTFEPGTILDEATDRRGLRAILEAGSKTGQGHAEQWLANLAGCELQPTDILKVKGRTYTMADYVAQVQWDVPDNVLREYSWTLLALTAYLPTDAEWIASDGERWSIERLVAIEVEQDVPPSACGGSHRLDGLAVALNRHLQQGRKKIGVWQDADEKIQRYVDLARRYQNPDGSFSSNYFQPGGKAVDLTQDLGATGHVLEFLTLALTADQLQEPWVKLAAAHLCEVLLKTRDVPLECGAVYHATHGLDIYHTRRFQRREYGASHAPESPLAPAGMRST